MSTLELKSVSKSFGSVPVVRDVNLAVKDREFVVLVGPSGCGKSTLLRMIAGLEEITEGEVLIDGEVVNDVSADARGLAMVFQSYALYPHMTVADNMGFALKLAGVDKATRAAKVLEAEKILQLEHLLERRPKELSGGQRQRVAIGRAIVRNPKIFLFDEPLSNLDAALRVQMRIELARLHRSLDATMIYVTHDQIEAMTMADRIVVMRDGIVEQAGAPLELYERPVNTFVAGFIGSPKMNLIGATVQAIEGNRALLAMPGGSRLSVEAEMPLSVGRKVTVGIRPEALHFVDEGEFAGAINVIERLGSETLCYVDIGADDLVTVEVAHDAEVAINDRRLLGVDNNRLHLFDDKGLALVRR